jgi:hypothetical protein
MHIDIYTKAVLTVIACCLLVIAAENILGPARAQSTAAVQKVAICRENGSACVAINSEIWGFPVLMTHNATN